MDCDSCGRHRPSDQVAPARSATGDVVMACHRCRRRLAPRPAAAAQLRAGPIPQRADTLGAA